MSTVNSEWKSHIWRGSAGEFHSLDLAFERAVWSCEVSGPALILGSTQNEADIDSAVASKHEVDIVRRRSGGGVVYVHPDTSLWCDVTIARNDVLWNDDVTASMLWLGEVFVDALAPWLTTSVYRNEFVGGQDGRAVCFASTSPGEVFADASKVVGISQRRTREGARFQCVLYRRWNPEQWVQCLTSSDIAERVRALPVAEVDITSRQLTDALLAALTRARI
jgi:lipoate-protein ligase A